MLQVKAINNGFLDAFKTQLRLSKDELDRLIANSLKDSSIEVFVYFLFIIVLNLLKYFTSTFGEN